MGKLTIIAALCAMTLAGLPQAARAQHTVTDQDEKNLEELSRRLIRSKKIMDRFMGDLAGAYSDQGKLLSAYGSDVRVDIIENAKDFVVKADLPGMDKDKMTVTLEQGKILKIAGSREMEVNESGPNVVRHERMEGKFERVIELPAECKPDGIGASYRNGVLEITIPKKEASKPETIKVDIK